MKLKNYEDLLNGDTNALVARKLLLSGCFGNIDGKGITPQSGVHVQVVLTGINDLSIAIARQVALMAHYPNFNDETGENRSVITFVQDGIDNREELERYRTVVADAMGYLMDECVCSTVGTDGVVRNRRDSFIDIEFEIVGLHSGMYGEYLSDTFTPADSAIVSLFVHDGTLDNDCMKKCSRKFYQVCKYDDEMMKLHDEELLVNVNKARMVNMVYQVGTYLKDINIRDIDDVKAYSTVLSTFAYHTPLSKVTSAWGRLRNVSLKMANVACADCFPARLRSLGDGKGNLQELLQKNLGALAHSEHARWCVEKLLDGYRPLTREERYHDELLYDTDRDRYRSYLKSQNVHFNLCSNRNLRRLDPEAIKYDCFLMLAMIEISKL